MMRLVAQLVRRRAFSTSVPRREKYGFIGLGQMGYEMARNLQGKLRPADILSVFDINSEPILRLEAERAQLKHGEGATLDKATSVQQACKDANMVFSVLPESKHVRSVYDSIVADAHPSPDAIFVDCSTIDPQTSRHVAATLASQGQRFCFVDAPMSGGVVGAAAARLVFMLGAPPNQLPAVERCLLLMGRRVLHCGTQGGGLVAKLANNYLLALSNIATAEAMNLGIRLGLDPAVLADVINASTGNCWPSSVNNPVPGVVAAAPASRGYTGGFAIALMKKDLGLAIEAAKEGDAKTTLGATAFDMYKKADKDPDCAGRDFSVVYRYIGGKQPPDGKA